jgi:K+-transporting ATPase ATPase C chain
MREAWRIFKLIVVLVVLLGLAYPLAMVLVGRLFGGKTEGDLLVVKGRVVGARSIGQEFTSSMFFHGRPSAAGKGYDGMKSGASNLGPTNPELGRLARERIASLLEENPGLKKTDIPVELVTGSASGLDPEISPESALLQVGRISKATGISIDELKALVEKHTAGRTMRIFGEPRVNVLELNIEVLTASGGALK